MKLRFVHVTADGLAPYLASLRLLEQGIRYPIADGADGFTIDHGPAYHPFFSRLGEAHFLLALRGDVVVGSIAGVLRSAIAGGRTLQALYLCDLKLAAEVRGQGVARRMLQRGLIELAKHPRGRKARLLYGAAMRGANGDVMRSARGAHPIRLGATIASQRLYFIPPAKLAALRGDGPACPLGSHLELSAPGDALLETTGAKDLRLTSTGEPWPLVHLTAAPWRAQPTWGAWLRQCGERLAVRTDGAVACLGLDERLTAHHRWLEDAAIPSGATCTIYGLSLTRSVGATHVAHLATSEI